jgi:3-oxoacyl-(acyl-carrier-protein) synthase
MTSVIITAARNVTSADLPAGRLIPRFGRMDLMCKLALLAVEPFAASFDAQPRDRIAICLTAACGSLAADFDFWSGHDAVGGPSGTLFAYTLPSAAIGEIAIRHRITGPNLCTVGGDMMLADAREMLLRGEADACVCISCDVLTPAIAELIHVAPTARASALFLRPGTGGLRELRESDRDVGLLCSALTAQNPTGL